MAFVSRSEKQSIFDFQLNTLGPGSYEKELIIKPKNNFVQESFAPFCSGDLRHMDKIDPEFKPGPGEYTHKPDFNNNLDINYQKHQTANFKSDVDRFYVKDKGIPDPGVYFEEFITKKEVINTDQQILDYLKSKKKKKPSDGIKSIPHRVKVISEHQSEEKSEKLPEKKTQIIDLEGYFIILGKGYGWSQQKEKKYTNHIKNETGLDLGPGKYGISNETVKIFQKKGQQNFMSKTLRSTQEKKGFIGNQYLLQKLKNDAMQLAENEQEIHDIEEKSLNINNFIASEHTNPGPGYYHNEQKQTKFKERQAKSSRFNVHRAVSSCGPGEYNNTKFNQFYKTTQGKFLGGDKFKIHDYQIPGPGTYQDLKEVIFLIQMQFQIKNKKKEWNYQHMKKTTIEKQENLEPGPAHYQNPDFFLRNKELDLISGKVQHQFMSTVERFDYVKLTERMDPGTYQQYHQTMKCDMNDKKLGTKHIPYQRTLPKQKIIFKQQETLQAEDQEIIKNAVSKKKEKKTLQDFSKEQKFKQLKSYTEKIGPGQYYDPKKTKFDTKTYNINFIDS